MADARFKKSLILVVLTLVFSLQSFGQKKGKLKEFTKEFPAYLSELGKFMTATDNNELKSSYKKFSKNSESLSEVERSKIILISNKMLDKRLKPKPYFSEFLSSLMIVNNHAKGESMLPEWLAAVEQTIENTTAKKMLLFCAFTNDLVKENILRSSKAVSWLVNTNDFHFVFEMIEPIILFNTDFNLSCTADGGS